MGMATGNKQVRIDDPQVRYCKRETKISLTDRDAQAVEADEVLAAVAAGELLAVAADGAVVLGGDVDLGVAGLLVGRGGGSLGGLDLGGGLGAVAGGGGDEGGHGGDEESLHEGHFVGLLVGLVGFDGGESWWWWVWKRVCWIGLDWMCWMMRRSWVGGR